MLPLVRPLFPRLLPLFAALLIAGIGPVRAENYALLIGVDKYDSSDITPLRGAVNDALALKEALISVGLCKASNITVLTTGGSGIKPDRAAILEEVDNLNTRVQKGDTVFVFYSGHGCQDGAKTYLLPSDVRAKSIPLVKRTAVDVDDFEDALRRLPDARVILAYDMCRVEIGKDGSTIATPAMQSRGMDFSKRNTNPMPKPNPVTSGPMLVRWWSCSPGERSYETQKTMNGDDRPRWRGYFSSAIERGLKGGAVASGGAVTLASLERFVRMTVTEEVRRVQARDQRPRLLLDVGGLDDIHTFVLAKGVDPGEKVLVDSGEKINLRARLSVTTNVPNAVITINGKVLQGGQYTESLLDEEKKTVQVVVHAPGYEPDARNVELVRGTAKNVAVTLEKAPEATRVPAGAPPLSSFHLTRGRVLLTLRGHSNSVSSTGFSPDGKRIVTGSGDRVVTVWDTQSGKSVLTLKGHSDGITSAEFFSEGKRIVTGSYDNTARLWDAVNGKLILTLKGQGNSISFATSSPDGKHIVTNSQGNTARIWNVANGKPLFALVGHSNSISCARFSPNSKRIVSGSGDNTAIVWNAASGKPIFTLKGHNDGVTSAEFSPDGKRIVTGSHDNTAMIWDAVSGKRILTLKGHNNSVFSAKFSPDGRHIVTGSSDNTAIVWDAAKGRPILTLKGHSNEITSAEFSPDGRRIVTGSSDNTAMVWQLE